MASSDVVVIGGGLSGQVLVSGIKRSGGSARLLSRSTGLDVFHDDVAAAISGADAVVEATGVFTTSRKKATTFFTGSTRAIGAAANRVGARHILLSIVNCMLPEVQGYGYFAGKTAQESAAQETGAELTIVRSTQWFEFAEQNLNRMRFAGFALVPSMTIQPVALDTVAELIAEVALGVSSPAVVEVAGPQQTTLWAMTRALPGPKPVAVPMPIPGRLGRSFAHGALLPVDDVEVRGPSFDAWLRKRTDEDGRRSSD